MASFMNSCADGFDINTESLLFIDLYQDDMEKDTVGVGLWL